MKHKDEKTTNIQQSYNNENQSNTTMKNNIETQQWHTANEKQYSYYDANNNETQNGKQQSHNNEKQRETPMKHDNFTQQCETTFKHNNEKQQSNYKENNNETQE